MAESPRSGLTNTKPGGEGGKLEQPEGGRWQEREATETHLKGAGDKAKRGKGEAKMRNSNYRGESYCIPEMRRILVVVHMYFLSPALLIVYETYWGALQMHLLELQLCVQ